MTTDELKAAAERLTRRARGEGLRDIYGEREDGDLTGQECRHVDQATLADAYLARLAADEAERAERERPIDEEWFCSIATIAEGSHYCARGEFLRSRLGGMELWFIRRDAVVWLMLTPDNFHLAAFSTRGQLLDLLRSLGVPTNGATP